jgi:RNA polymerase sigma-70 factor (ECF subfamily)
LRVPGGRAKIFAKIRAARLNPVERPARPPARPTMNSGPPEPNRDFLALMMPNQRSIRNFIYSIHPEAGDLDDLMQDTAISLWEKFDTFDHSREFLPWAMRLAYFEVLRFRKKRSRDRLVFSDQLVDVLAGEAPEAVPAEPVRQALESCLCQLDGRARDVIEARYGHGTSITDLAAARNESVHRLYRILEKVRGLLIACVRRQLAAEGHRLPR